MGLRDLSLAAALVLLFASAGYGQTALSRTGRSTPDFAIQTVGFIAADFSTRVMNYFELRRSLEVGLPPQTVTADPAEFLRAEQLLASKIRFAREGARQGEIFTPAVSVEFKRVLLLIVDADTWTAIMDDNPGSFSSRINGTYPKSRPHSTVPPNILALLPRLPADIEYRFLGRHLILYDLRANVILDRIPYAIQFRD